MSASMHRPALADISAEYLEGAAAFASALASGRDNFLGGLWSLVYILSPIGQPSSINSSPDSLHSLRGVGNCSARITRPCSKWRIVPGVWVPGGRFPVLVSISVPVMDCMFRCRKRDTLMRLSWKNCSSTCSKSSQLPWLREEYRRMQEDMAAWMSSDTPSDMTMSRMDSRWFMVSCRYWWGDLQERSWYLTPMDIRSNSLSMEVLLRRIMEL
mmetsp:Transcript_29584/g.65595  ORF Transcript_29584/g.65595 Transcript_29584/m.65595 type:complete len:213 (-) Transcript_29584:337-975(-)